MAASTLRAGALALVSYTTDDSPGVHEDDVLRFVVLAPIGSGTIIYFTDRTWTPRAGSTMINDGSFAAAGGNEGTFTLNVGTDLNVGDVITITTAQLSAAGINLDPAGEMIFVYQGTDPNTPTEFLYAADIADGNTSVSAPLLLNTGLSVLAGTAIGVGHDNASFGGHATGSPQHQLAEIADTANNWHGSDADDGAINAYDERAYVNLGGPLTAPDMQLYGAMTGGGQADAILRIDNDEASNVGTNLARLLRDNPAFISMEDIAFDLEDGVWFAVMNEGTDITRIIKGNISDLNNTGATPVPTFTVIFEYNNDAANSNDDKFIQGIEIDKTANRIFFTLGDLLLGHELRSVDYNGANSRNWGPIDLLTTVGPGFAGGVEDFVIDPVGNTAYFTYVLVEVGPNIVYHNYIVKLTAQLNAAAPNPNVENYAIVNIANAGPPPAGYPAGRVPDHQGSVRGIDFDPATNTVWFVTGRLGAGGTGGVFKLDMATLNYTEMWEQPSNNAHNTPQAFPTTLLHDIEVDSIGGRYYLTDQSSTDHAFDGTPGTDENGGNVWSGSLASAGAPTLFADNFEPNGGATKGMEINYAPTTTALVSANATYTESNNNLNTPAGPAVQVGGAPTLNDVDTTNLKGAVVAITGFQPGDVLGFTNSGGITGSYNANTGVLTFTGSASYAQYATVLDTITFTNSGDNPTDYGLSPSRTLTFQVTDGLAYSDPATVTVTVVGINDAPFNTPGVPMNYIEDTTGNNASLPPVNAITGISIFDPDANPSTQDIRLTLSVGVGTILIRTDVAGGITAADITGGANGTGTIVITATQNQINKTLAALNGSSQANGLVFTPPADFNGATNLTITTNDLGLNGNDPLLTGTGTSEEDIDTKTLNVADVNDAPTVVDATQDSPTILEDTPYTNLNAPSVATLFTGSFSDALDVQVSGGNLTGSPGDTLAGIAVVANGSNANGNWQWWDGDSWENIGNVTVDSARTYSAATLIRFNPTLNYNGAAPTLTVRLIESSSVAVTNNAIVDLNPGPGTTGDLAVYTAGTVVLSQAITAVNDAPVNTPGATVNINEDATNVVLSTTASAMMVADVEATGDISYTLSVEHGTLTIRTDVGGGINATDIVGGANGSDTIIIQATRAEINATLAALNALLYTPTPHYNGVDTLEVYVNDLGQTGQDPNPVSILDPVVDPDPGPITEEDLDLRTINIASVNDAPSGADKTIAMNEDGTRILAAADFGFTDPIDSNILSAVVLTTLPATGDLYLNNVAITVAGTVISAADIGNNLLTFKPDPNTSGVGYTSFTFQVRDNGGTANGGQNTDQSANTISFDVNAINDAPVHTVPGAQSMNEDATLTFNAANLNPISIADVDAAAGDLMTTITVADGALSVGTVMAGLQLSGEGTNMLVLTGTLAEINDALEGLSYAPPAHAHGPRTITVTTNDNGHTSGNLLVNPDAEAGASAGDFLSTVAPQGWTPVTGNFSAVDYAFGAADDLNSADSTANNGDASYFAGGPTAGDSSVRQTVSVAHYAAEIDAGLIDAKLGGLLGGRGTEDDRVFLSMRFLGAANQDLGTVTLFGPLSEERAEESSLTFRAAFADVPVGTRSIEVTILAERDDVNPGSSYNDAYADNLSLTLVRTAVSTIPVTINSINDAPAGANNGDSVLESATHTFTVANFATNMTDPNDSPANVFAGVRITTLPGAGNGTIFYDADGGGVNPPAAIAAGDSFTAQDLIDGKLTYVPSAGTGGTMRTFTFQVRDNGGTTGGGIDLDPNADTFTFTITAPQASPVINDLAGDTANFTEGGSAVLLDDSGAPELLAAVTDIDSADFNGGTVTVSITGNEAAGEDVLGISTGGTVTLSSGTSVGSIVSVGGQAIGTISSNGTGGNDLVIALDTVNATPANVSALIQALTYSNTNTANPSTMQRTIAVSVSDGDGGSDSENVLVNVAGTNDAPVITVQNAAVSGTEDKNLVFNAANLNAITMTDVDDTSLTVTLTVLNGTLTLAGTGGLSGLSGNGTATVTFTGSPADINTALNGLIYRGGLNYEGSDTLTVQVGDGDDTDSENIAITLADDGIIHGNSGNNILTGTPQPDFFWVDQGGNDDLTGQESNDVFLFGNSLTTADKVNGNGGIDQIAIQGNYLLILGADILSVESLALLPGNDTRFGDTANNFYDYNITTVNANVEAGVRMIVDANRLRVGEDLTFNGSAESDGSFLIFGGLGVDTLTGGGQTDVFLFGAEGQWGPSDTIVGGGGTDQLALRGDYTVIFGATQMVSIENIALLSAFDTRFGALGESYVYNLTMNDGNVVGVQLTIDGAMLRPTETLTFNGAAEDDGSFRVFGGDGNDVIGGSQNGDIVVGRGGFDTMTGNGGDDVFRFNLASDSTSPTPDKVMDFGAGDLIDLLRIDADTSTAGDQAFSFIDTDAFNGVAGELRFQSNGANEWLIQGDTDGDGDADFELILNIPVAHTITSADFIL